MSGDRDNDQFRAHQQFKEKKSTPQRKLTLDSLELDTFGEPTLADSLKYGVYGVNGVFGVCAWDEFDEPPSRLNVLSVTK